MKNLHILKTDKPSRVAIQLDCKPKYNIQLAKKENDWTKNWEKQTIYITSDEYIGLSYYLDGDLVRKGVVDDKDYWKVRKDYKKIILTTDPQLIQDGVQAIDDTFLEWFVKNPSCEEVEVEEEDYSQKCRECGETVKRGYSCKKGCFMKSGNFIPTDKNIKYKIIIPKEDICSFCDGTGQVVSCTTISRFKTCDCKITPKEEPKQETFEEGYNRIFDNRLDRVLKAGFTAGAKWQQEQMYSEEEVIELLEKRDKYLGNWLPPKKWLEQFKKQIR